MSIMKAEKPTPQAFGSSGGKAHLAKKIAPMMPEHTTYVEPYAGGAAVYFYKEPVAKEILNDKDKEIAFAYRFIRDMTPAQYKALQRKDWVISKKRFDATKRMKPTSDVDRFYKFYYTKKGSFRYMMESVTPSKLGKTIGIERLPKVKARLKGTASNSADALTMITKHDSKNTLFYLDPPYPSTSRIGGNAPDFTEEDLAKLTDRLKHIKGKFILSMDTANAKQFPSNFNVKRMSTQEHKSDGTHTIRIEAVATNYPTPTHHRSSFKRRRMRKSRTSLYDTHDGYRSKVRLALR